MYAFNVLANKHYKKKMSVLVISSQSMAYALARAIADPAFIFIILLSKKPGEPDYNTDLLWVLLPYCG